MKSILFAILAFSFSMPALASDCFWARSARGFEVPKNSEMEMIVEVGTRDYKLSLSFCSQFDLDWARRIGFRTWGSSRVCQGDEVVLYDISGRRMWPDCNIDSIERVD